MPDTPESQGGLDGGVLAETEQQIFRECAERFRMAESFESANRVLAVEDLEFCDGQQWPDDLYNQRKIQRRPTLTVNHTQTLVRRVVNNMREQRPRIKVHPVSDATMDDARVVSGMIRHIENLSTASVAYDTGGESAVKIGWGYARIMGEYCDEKSFEQELKIKPVRNTLTGYIDPSATLPDGSDMEWFIFTEKLRKTEFKRLYPKEPMSDFVHGGAGDAESQWETRHTIRVAEYYRIKYTRETLCELSDGRTMFRSDFKLPAMELAGITIVNERPSTKRQVQWFRINGTKVVQQRDLPGRWIPVVRFEGNVVDINGDIRRKGMIRDLKDPARMANFWETAKTEKLALSSKAPWVMAEGQADGHPEWDDANQKPYSALKYKILTGMDGQPIPGIPPPMRQPAVEVEAGFAETASSAAKNLLMVAGMPHEPGVDAPGTVVSGVALRRRQAISDISHFQYYDNQTLAIAQVGRILLDLIPYYYGKERMQRIIGEDGVPSMVAINKLDPAIGKVKYDMKVGTYDVVMDTGPGYDTKRQEAAEAMIDLMKTPLGEVIVKTGADIALRNMDFPGSDDLADRAMPLNAQGMQKAIESLPHEARGIVQALMIKDQQQTQAIQQLQQELKLKTGIEQGWMQVELAKAKLQTDTKANDAAVAAHTKLTDTHVRAQSSIAVAEIAAAGKLLDTHVGGKYDREAREHELEVAKATEKANGQGSHQSGSD